MRGLIKIRQWAVCLQLPFSANPDRDLCQRDGKERALSQVGSLAADAETVDCEGQEVYLKPTPVERRGQSRFVQREKINSDTHPAKPLPTWQKVLDQILPVRAVQHQSKIAAGFV